MERTKPTKPLGIKAYGSIPHLIGSNRGPADKGCNEGQHRICTEKCRKGDRIIIQEKLDGSCCSVAKLNNKIIALQRGGYPAESSPYEQHHLFADWVHDLRHEFADFLHEGERVVGEWLAQAHGTKYKLGWRRPFVPFDIMVGMERVCFEQFHSRIKQSEFMHPFSARLDEACPIEEAFKIISPIGNYMALEPIEGVIYRIERNGRVDFLAKYVRPDFIPGKYLPEISGADPVWNWRPKTL